MSHVSFEMQHLAGRTVQVQAVLEKQKQEFFQIFEACEALKKNIAEIEARLPTMASAAYRSNAQNRIRHLRAQLKTRLQRQRSLGLSLRMAEIRTQLGKWTQKKQELDADAFFEVLCHESLAPLKKVLIDPPYGGRAWRTALDKMEETLRVLCERWLSERKGPAVKSALQALKVIPFPPKANDQEKGLLRRYLLLIENAFLQASNPLPEARLKSLQSLQPQSVQGQSKQLTGLGDFQVSFDMASGKTLVKDQLGVAVNQERKPYANLLAEGKDLLDKGLLGNTPRLPFLQEAIKVLSTAISLEARRFEAYFFLGYLFAQIEDWTRAIKLLEMAENLSQREDITLFLKEVQLASKQSLSLSA